MHNQHWGDVIKYQQHLQAEVESLMSSRSLNSSFLNQSLAEGYDTNPERCNGQFGAFDQAGV